MKRTLIILGAIGWVILVGLFLFAYSGCAVATGGGRANVYVNREIGVDSVVWPPFDPEPAASSTKK
jgi:hypothetical protein